MYCRIQRGFAWRSLPIVLIVLSPSISPVDQGSARFLTSGWPLVGAGERLKHPIYVVFRKVVAVNATADDRRTMPTPTHVNHSVSEISPTLGANLRNRPLLKKLNHRFAIGL